MEAQAERPESSIDIVMRRNDISLERLEAITHDARALLERVAGAMPPRLETTRDEAPGLAAGGHVDHLQRFADKLEHVADQLADIAGQLSNHL